MNKTDLYSYIASLGIKHQHYDWDTLYQIGLMHKELPQKDKNWKELNDVLNHPFKDGEAYRTKVKKRLQRELLKKHTTLTIENEKRSLMIQKQALRDDLTEYRAMMRVRGRSEDLKEKILLAIDELKKRKKLDFGKAPALIDNGVEVALAFGDPHIGLETKSRWNEYNYAEAERRAKHYTKEVVAFCKLFGADTIHFCNVGDLIHGIIHSRVRFDSEFGIDYQLVYAGELVAQILCELQKHFKVIYRSVVDNHGRVVANKEEHKEEENFNHTIDYFLQARLKGSRVEFRTQDNLDDTMSVFKLKSGKLFGFAHGHLDKKNQVFQNFVGATKKYIDYILLGHYHNSAVHNFQNCRVFINGSFSGCDPYATNNRLYGDPCQKLLIFNKQGDIIDIDISLKGVK